MNIMLFGIVLAISFIAVRIGAIAFEITGVEWSLAKFQALSCFTGTGFTTRESELITGNRQRRRIASVLMVLGNAGLVTLIATFANSMRPDSLVSTIFNTGPWSALPSWLSPIFSFFVAGLVVYVIFRLFTYDRFGRKLTGFLRKHILKREIINPVSFEELLVATGGYGVSTVGIRETSPVAGKKLSESDLRLHDITVLAVEREDKITPNPPASTVIEAGDRLVCFGKLDRIHEELKVGYDRRQDG